MKKKIINILEQHSVYRRVEEESFKEVAEQIVSEIKTYTEEDLRKLVDLIDESYRGVTRDNTNGSEILEDFLLNGFAEEKVEEKEIPITYGLIKATCGWSKFCDVTGGNHYAINEWGGFEDREVFFITESQAIELGIIKE